MRTSIELPDDLHRRVRAKSALDGRAVREVAAGLLARWTELPTGAPFERGLQKVGILQRIMTRHALLILAAGLAAPLAAQQRAPADAPLRVGPLTVRPGEAVSGAIPVPAGSDAGTTIPLSVIRGRAPGPVLALIAGTHGSETAPIVALQRVRALVDPAALRGTLILVHVANMPSFTGRTIYYSPVDGKNLNRVYPGRLDGTSSERIAHAITTEVIDRADYVVDMHAGDGNESLRPYTYWSRLGLDPAVDSAARELALAWGHDRIVVDDDRPRDRARSLYTQNTAQVRGKPAITTETGWLGVPDEEMVRRNVDGAFRLLRHLRMLDGPVERVTHPIWLVRTTVLTSPATGTWHAAVERGHTVAAGTLVGRVTDYAGRQLAEVRAPFAGEVLYVIGTPAMREGEPVAMLGQAGEPGPAPR
ncbi:MAG: M14 family metallopeptidase [Gemmatimonadales bacterium]|nr:M14 family metallopeptidase [Gemmatimonadales bacterium]